MKARDARRAWYGGLLLSGMVSRALARRFPVAGLVAFCMTAVGFLVWLARDNLQFRREVAAQRQRLAERRATVRAAKEAAAVRAAQELAAIRAAQNTARPVAENEPRSPSEA